MPGGDGTGPMGTGPRMGRRSGGRGWRHCFRATGLKGWQRQQIGTAAFADEMPVASREQELQSLQQQARTLENTLEQLRQRIERLQGYQPTP